MNDERRTTNDERQTMNDERRTTNDGFCRHAHARVITDFKNMADYHEERTLKASGKGENAGRQERLPQDYKRLLRRDKCWKKTETTLD